MGQSRKRPGSSGTAAKKLGGGRKRALFIAENDAKKALERIEMSQKVGVSLS